MRPPVEIPDAAPVPEAGRWHAVPGAPSPARRRPLHPAVNLVCLLLTVVTTLLAGTLMTLDDLSWATLVDIVRRPAWWSLGAPYSLSLLLILGAHEMGHYVACRYYGIEASWPFFIPAPHLFGTFGAVIKIRAPFTDRRAMFDIGVAGPIAGFVVAVPVLLYGLSRSIVVREAPLPGTVGLTSCLLLEILYPLYFALEPGVSVRLDPVFAAAWLGLFATSLNLLPIGQLDGGHMLYAISSRLHRIVSRAGVAGLVVAGVAFGGWHLVTFAVLFLFIGVGHPRPIDETTPLGRGRLTVAALGLLIFLLCFIPATPVVF